MVCILAPGTLGLVFGMMAMRPAWFSTIMPMYFILTGFTTAVSFMLFFTSLLPRDEAKAPNVNHLYHEVLPRLFFIALLAVIGMRFGQIITGLWSNYEGMEAHWLQLQSPFFWIEIVAGLALPTALMAFDSIRRRPLVQFVAASLFNIGIFFSRLELLIMGQKVPLFKGYWAGYVDYWPSLTEWMLIPAGCGVFLFLYGAGNWLLRLSDTEVGEPLTNTDGAGRCRSTWPASSRCHAKSGEGGRHEQKINGLRRDCCCGLERLHGAGGAGAKCSAEPNVRVGRRNRQLGSRAVRGHPDDRAPSGGSRRDPSARRSAHQGTARLRGQI